MTSLNVYGASFFVLLLFGVTAASQVTNKAVPITDVCELLSNPKPFLDEIVVVKAKFNQGFESGWLEPINACVNRQAAIKYLFDQGFQSASGRKGYRLFRRKLKAHQGGLGVPAFIGVFRIKAEPYAKTNDMDRRFDFQLRILSVQEIE